MKEDAEEEWHWAFSHSWSIYVWDGANTPDGTVGLYKLMIEMWE